MDVLAEAVGRAHGGLLPWRALLAAGLHPERARVAISGLRRVHDGVHLTGSGPLTRHQRWLAATLSAPGTVLSHASAGALHGLRPWEGGFEVVTRPGSGGPRRIDGMLVCRSSTLDGNAEVRDGIPVTTGARTVVDLAAHLDRRARDKVAREAVRLHACTALELRLAARRHRGRRGTRGLADLAARLERLPIERTRSDAEARALEVLAAAGLEVPAVNVWIADEEADLVWRGARRIVEIDGPQYHRDPVEDARKEAAWRAAGWTVDRLHSDVPFDEPERLVTLVATCERPSDRA